HAARSPASTPAGWPGQGWPAGWRGDDRRGGLGPTPRGAAAAPPRHQRGPRARPASGWYALTPTERRIAQLVAQGRSNPDIATELYLSRRTVQSHVSHILTKLDAHSRGEIAGEVGRRAARHPRAG